MMGAIVITGYGTIRAQMEAERSIDHLRTKSASRKRFGDGKQRRENMSNEPTIHNRADLICFSHLRWGFVWQRPQHLMSRFARQRRVYFVEEPEYKDAAGLPRLE